MVDEEITDCDGSFAFWIESRSVFRQCEAISSEPKSFSGDRYELRFRHRSPDVLSLMEQEIYHREPTGSSGLWSNDQELMKRVAVDPGIRVSWASVLLGARSPRGWIRGD